MWKRVENISPYQPPKILLIEDPGDADLPNFTPDPGGNRNRSHYSIDSIPKSEIQLSVASILEKPNIELSEKNKELAKCILRTNNERQKELAAALLDEYISSLFAKGIQSHQNIRRRRRHTPQPNNREQRQELLFRRVQALYKKYRARLVAAILDNTPMEGDDVRPPIQEVEAAYRRIFEGEFTSNIASPIVTADIHNTLKAMKSNSAWPDGLRTADLRVIPLHRIELLLNCMLPGVLRANRTALLSKSGGPANVNNLRPITISSVLSRLLNKILDARVTRMSIIQLQAGFSKMDGTLLNNLLVQTAIKDRRSKTKPYCILTLDLRRSPCHIILLSEHFIE